jgi:hypothetical protein
MNFDGFPPDPDRATAVPDFASPSQMQRHQISAANTGVSSIIGCCSGFGPRRLAWNRIFASKMNCLDATRCVAFQQPDLRWMSIKRNHSCGVSIEMGQSCGTESPYYRCFRDTWIAWGISARHRPLFRRDGLPTYPDPWCPRCLRAVDRHHRPAQPPGGLWSGCKLALDGQSRSGSNSGLDRPYHHPMDDRDLADKYWKELQSLRDRQGSHLHRVDQTQCGPTTCAVAAAGHARGVRSSGWVHPLEGCVHRACRPGAERGHR